MSTFSVNQARQLYVVKDKVDYDGSALPSAAGVLRAQSQGGYAWFDHYGPAGLTRSDLINLDHVKYTKSVNSNTLATTMAKKLITIESGALSAESKTLAGQDYIFKVEFNQWGAPGLENQYYKYATVRGNGVDEAKDFYVKLYKSLVQNFSIEDIPVFKFGLVGTIGGMTVHVINADYKFKVVTGSGTSGISGDTITINTNGLNTADAINAALVTASLGDLVYVADRGTPSAVSTAAYPTYTGVTMEELPQPWVLGAKSFETINFNCRDTAIKLSTGEEVHWSKVVDSTVNNSVIGNGKLVCDLEWFTAGERGDIYRGVSAPYYPKTELLGEKDATYSLIEIGFAYYDAGVDEFPSERTLTLAVKDGAGDAKYTLVNALSTELNVIFGENSFAALS